MKWNTLLTAVLLGVAIAAPGVHADDVPGVRGSYLRSIADVKDKIVSLAEAMPDKKYSWRPAKGVRSMSEVYAHVVLANYMLPSFAGAQMPATITPELEKTLTEKPKVVAMLKDSFAHLEQVITDMPDADLDKVVKTFLGDMPERDLFLLTVTHGHEHLGQAIAYARMNGVTPPWTAAQDAKAKAHGEGDAKKEDAK